MTSKSIYNWIDERLGLSELAAFARHKTVPVHSQSFWVLLGRHLAVPLPRPMLHRRSLAGLLPAGAEAYESVRQITFVMHFGCSSARRTPGPPA